MNSVDPSPERTPSSHEDKDRLFGDDNVEVEVASVNSAPNVFDKKSGVKRGLRTRHLSMMALAGIIGPGLLLGSGRALSNGGPAALLIGFGVIGIIAYCIMQSIGEMTTQYPTNGGFLGHTEKFVNRACQFVVGWNYFIVWFAVLANEYNAVCSVLYSWSDKVPIYGYFLLFWAFFTSFQMFGITAFGEAEFWLALIKLLGLGAFFIFAIVYMSGGIKDREAFGFAYWNNPGAFANGFRGVAEVFVFTSTFYAGIEAVAVASSETRNPRRAIPIAIRQVVGRILFVYMGSAIFFGATCPYDAPQFSIAGNRVLTSPMTVAIQQAGWEGGFHLINAFVIVTCLSAINSSIYIASRTVLFMAHTGNAPKFLTYTNKRGVPVAAIVFTNLFGFLALMNISTGAAKAYNYIVNLSGVSTFIVWAGITLTHLRFRHVWKKSGRTTDSLILKATWFPYLATFGLVATVILALVQGWGSFSPFSGPDFVVSYVLLPVSAIAYVAIAWWDKQFSWRNRHEIDLQDGMREDLDRGSPAKWYQFA